jgi:hypothetical protein
MADEWTVDTLKLYADAAIAHASDVARIAIEAAEKLSSQRFEDQQIAVTAALAAQKEAVAAALTAADRAVAKAETAAERRFASVNEFRAQLSDQAATFMSRAEALLQIYANTEKIDALSARMDRGEGGHAGAAESRSEQRQSQAAGISQGVLVSMGIAILISIAALITSIVMHH